MDINTYFLEWQVNTKLAEARAAAARAALLASLRAERRGVLAVVGLALIKAGRWLGRRSGGRRQAARLLHPGLPAQ